MKQQQSFIICRRADSGDDSIFSTPMQALFFGHYPASLTYATFSSASSSRANSGASTRIFSACHVMFSGGTAKRYCLHALFPQTPLARRADALQGGQGRVMMYLAGSTPATDSP